MSDINTKSHSYLLGQAEAKIEHLTSQLSDAQKELQRIKDRIDTRLNNALCEMKEGYDDSIVGFNEAWDIVRKCFPAHKPDMTAAMGTKE
jgi:hypothetical protein